MSSDDQLRELARIAGIDPGYWDISGTYHEASAETLRALLSALGVEAQDNADVRSSIVTLTYADWLRLSPTVVVVRNGQSFSVSVHLSEELHSRPLMWKLTFEDGTDCSGEVGAGRLPEEAATAVRGRAISRRCLSLPPTPAGYHRLAVYIADQESQTAVISAPEKCFLPTDIGAGGRLWGISSQLYGIRSRHNWGIGDFTDLRALTDWAAARGADVVGLNPLHALFAADPNRSSPYSASSRLFLNPLYLDVTAIEDFRSAASDGQGDSPQFSARLAALRQSNLVNYAEVMALKRPALEGAYASFSALCARHSDHPRVTSFRRFCDSRGESLRRYAIFEALGESMGNYDWLHWPERWRHPASSEVQAFSHAHTDRLTCFQYIQWQTELQLANSAEHALNGGLKIGLYLDLAISSDPSGSDVWSAPDTFTPGVRVGAPPDPLGPLGQEWGIVPMSPPRVRQVAYAPVTELFRAAMRHAGALRIDHAMGLERLFWVPQGMPPSAGTYVRQPREELAGILALESHRNQCLVIGEDLGTVPEGFRSRMDRASVLSYRVLFFERTESAFKRPQDYPALAAACVTTHDLPTLRGFWSGDDLAIRHRLGLFADAQEFAAAQAGREHAKRTLIEALFAEGLLVSGPATHESQADLSNELAVAIHAYVARSSSALFIAEVSDLTGQEHQVNVPGTWTQYPNWCQRLPINIEELRDSARAQEIAAAITLER